MSITAPISRECPAGNLPAPPVRPAVPPRFVVRFLLGCHRWLQRLAHAVIPPQFVVVEHAAGLATTQLLAIAARLRIADLLASGPRTAQELAQETQAHPEAMHRMLRALVSLNVFALDTTTGRFRNNRLSSALRTDITGSARAIAEYFGTSANMLAWADAEETIRTGRNAFERVHGMTVWDWFACHPEEERLFADGMQELTAADAPAVAAAYPFGEVQRICDVGGGRGTLLAYVLAVHPHLRGVLFEAPGIVEMAREFLHAWGLADRVDIRSGNFFASVPDGCDAYLLKDVLHDWDDAHALQILRTIRQTMQPGQRVLICETLVEPMETALPGPLIDVCMMMVCREGRQRSRTEVTTLLEQAGLTCIRVLPTALPISIVEGRLAGKALRQHNAAPASNPDHGRI